MKNNKTSMKIVSILLLIVLSAPLWYNNIRNTTILIGILQISTITLLNLRWYDRRKLPDGSRRYSMKTLSAIIFVLLAIIALFSKIHYSYYISMFLTFISFLLSFLDWSTIPPPTDVIKTDIKPDIVDDTTVILGDPNGYEISPTEAFGYTYSLSSPEKWFGWNDTDYISDKLSSQNMYVRVLKRHIK